MREVSVKLLALAVLLPTGFASALGLMVWSSASMPLLGGQIVMEQASYCEVFVIKTDHGLAVVVDESRWPVVISSGTNVSGLRHEKGAQTIQIDNRAELRIHVLLWQTDWNLAKARFEQECDRSAPGRLFEAG
jgi:hypothetical protein